MLALGDLEMRVMEALWAQQEPRSVRSVHDELAAERDLAYTTILTVLDRLSKKGRVVRTREGRAWLYRAAASRAVMVARAMVDDLAVADTDRREALVEFVERLPDADRTAVSELVKGSRPARSA